MKAFLLVNLFLASSLAFSADTASVLKCYKEAYSPASGLNCGFDDCATLCSHVNSDADIKAVFECAKKAYSGTGLNTTATVAAQLCTNVTK